MPSDQNSNSPDALREGLGEQVNAGDIAIRVSNLSKCYQIYSTPRERLKQFIFPRMQRLAGQTPKQYFREFWALKDVSFEIKKGESVGIIGRNGSGKSTLLQIICGTLTPTSGSVESNGRVAALLELGSGFNPEFTGRENVYMNAAMLGLSKEEVDERFADIAAFADIGEFIERPVKSYSSGMYVRLAFAVAINVDAEILIVDEALSVGDELFQRKCFSRIEGLRNKGATILFVSHSGSHITQLCNCAILLDEGEKLVSGDSKRVVDLYQKLLYSSKDTHAETRQLIIDSPKTIENQVDYAGHAVPLEPFSLLSAHESFNPALKPYSTTEYESDLASIECPEIRTLNGERVNHLITGRTYKFIYSVRFFQEVTQVRFGMLIKTISGVEIGGAISARSVADSIEKLTEGSRVQVEFEFCCSLNQAVYFINAGVIGINNGMESYLHRLVDADVFRVLAENEGYSLGIVNFDPQAKVSYECRS